jgi:hypothetical protein
VYSADPVAGGFGDDARSLRRLPGGAIVVDADGDLDVGTGRRTVTIFAHTPQLRDEALRNLRPRTAATPLGTLPPPVYPRAVLGELRRVQVQQRRTPDLDAMKRALGISKRTLRLRLRLIDLLPKGALRGVAVPRLPVAEVDRRSQAVLGLVDGIRPDGVDARTLARWERSVRGLAGGC